MLVAWVLARREGGDKDVAASFEWGAVAASLAWPVALTTSMEAFTSQVRVDWVQVSLFCCFSGSVQCAMYNVQYTVYDV